MQNGGTSTMPKSSAAHSVSRRQHTPCREGGSSQVVTKESGLLPYSAQVTRVASRSVVILDWVMCLYGVAGSTILVVSSVDTHKVSLHNRFL